MARRVVLIIGAGSTVADVAKRSLTKRPPLDKKFFRIAAKRNKSKTDLIVSYIKENYGLSILKSEHDSLEEVMAMIYTDIFDPVLGNKASEVFRELIALFNKRLADTTNNLPATQQRYLYRIIARYFYIGIKPEDLTMITFNQDLQIEKILDKFSKTKCYKRFGKIFNFPSCYSLPIPIEPKYITSPKKVEKELFNIDRSNSKGVRILKLHGSLNWYSTHISPRVSPRAMFRSDRTIRITCRQTIDPHMKLAGPRRIQHTLPVVVPPVTHKSAILHNHIKSLWTIAGEKLKKANEVVIFGYSCPVMDFESSNLIQRSLKANRTFDGISVIDPDSNVLKRYADLIKPKRIYYYPLPSIFLESR